MSDAEKSDHELILLLKDKIDDLTADNEIIGNDLEVSLSHHNETSHQLALHEKLSAQHTLLKHIFYF